ncbi:hypothetical protein N0X72_25485 [Streptomyces carpaticus]|uniref:hypothetical protein n=1 Tax=Streptomyces carpaticus TaxID=285558 RepID=UPI0021FDC147|nr:hypothetical protein N0X72_25485 [Streptomyces carpaticus]
MLHHNRPAYPGINVTAARAITARVAEAATVLITPVTLDGRTLHRVLLLDAAGAEVGTADAARRALRLLREAFPAADWSREQLAHLGRADLTEQRYPAAPIDLGLDAEGGDR